MADRLKDQYWFKLIKWYSYKRFKQPTRWHTQFAFDAALRRLKAGDIVLDCGANVGKYTAHLALTGATVHAFEPDSYSFQALQRNTANFPNVHLHNAAVGTRDGEIEIYRAPDFESDPEERSLSTSIFADKINVSTEDVLTVRLVDLCAFVAGLGKPASLTKIDIEGAEVPLLEHIIARGEVERFGAIFVETHETKVPSLAERTASLRKLCARDHARTIHLDWD